jgi:glucose/arabinose dehydrogenase
LIIGFHGYREHGHRLVAVLPDRAGAPLGKMVELIGGWGPKAQQAMGAPVDVKQGADGNIYIVEDRTGRVVRLQADSGTAQ